jgi:hypothetical protein
MRTTIEVTSRAIRLCREDKGRITALESYEVPAGSDPLQALEQAPLPTPLGRVRLVLSHGDMLLRSMVQPPCPVERLGKIVRFELQSAGDTEPVVACWHLVAGMGSGDMRLLTMVTKRKLLTELRSILKGQGGTLDALIHPAIGVYQSYRALGLSEQGAGMIVDIGGSHLHLVLIQDGELLFLRTLTPGMEDLVKQVAEMRNLSMADAAQLVAKLGKGAPADLHEAIKRQVGAVAGVLAANIKFAKAQLRIDAFDPKSIWISGAGAQVHGFAEALSERMGAPVLPINPFSGARLEVPRERLDRLAALPSPWSVAIGTARAATLELDACQEDRELRSLFWRTQGVLRVAAVAVALLMVLALVRQEFSLRATLTVLRILDGSGGEDGGGLVRVAEKARAELDKVNSEKAATTARMTWIDGERRPGRVAVELLSAIAEQGNPMTCPVYLQSYKVSRKSGQVEVDLEGFAQGAGQSASDAILRRFEHGLIRRYLPITAIKQLPKPIDPTKQQFHFVVTVSDVPAEISTQAGKAGAIAVTLALPAGIDAEGAAFVAATRVHTAGAQTVAVKVVPAVQATDKDPKDKDKAKPQDIEVSFKD